MFFISTSALGLKAASQTIQSSSFQFNDIPRWTHRQCHILNKQCPIKIKFFSMSSAKNNFSMILSSFCLINHWTVVQGKSAERAIKPFFRTSIDCSIHGEVFRVQRIARIHFSLNVVAVGAREVKTTLQSLSSTLCLPIESIWNNFFRNERKRLWILFLQWIDQSHPRPKGDNDIATCMLNSVCLKKTKTKLSKSNLS